MKSKDRRTITLGTKKTLLRQHAANTSTAKIGGNDKHAHDRPLWTKKFRFGHTGANIRDSANDLAFNFSNNNFSSFSERGHISDFCLESRPVLIQVPELLKGPQSQRIDLC